MTFRVNHLNRATGVTYVYEATAVWDKDKRQSRNRQVCIGKIDPQTGEFIPSRRLDSAQAAVRDPAVTATARIIGPACLLDKATSDLGLERLLKSCFPKDYLQILSMAYFLVCRGGPLSHCEAWSVNHQHPYGKPLTTQRMTEILRTIDEDRAQTFFGKWARKVLEKDYLCYDITSVSSYSELNEYVKYGYNRDGEKLRQINLAMLFGQESQLPIYYRRLPGNIGDVSTLHNFLEAFRFLNLPKVHVVMDKGFYSQKNVKALLEARDKFTLAVPNRATWVQKSIDKVRGSIQGPEGYRKLDDEILYVHSELLPWGEDHRRCYLHLYYNAHTAADVIDNFTKELLGYKDELESGKLVKVHREAYKTFFVVHETPVRGRKVCYNNEAIEKYRSQYAGFLAILTNDMKDPVQTLMVYRNKDVVEKCFDDLKNQLDMKRLRIHGSASMAGRFFVQFIALIYMSSLRRDLRKAHLIEKFTVRELLEELEPLTRIDYSGKYGHLITEVSKTQRQILEDLGAASPA